LIDMSLPYHQDHSRIAIEQGKHFQDFSPDLRPDRVFVESRDDIHRPSRQRRQRLRTPFQVEDLNGEADFLEISQLVAECKREVYELGLSPDTDLERGFLQGAGSEPLSVWRPSGVPAAKNQETHKKSDCSAEF